MKKFLDKSRLLEKIEVSYRR